MAGFINRKNISGVWKTFFQPSITEYAEKAIFEKNASNADPGTNLPGSTLLVISRIITYFIITNQ
jgi:hypothetical protein